MPLINYLIDFEPIRYLQYAHRKFLCVLLPLKSLAIARDSPLLNAARTSLDLWPQTNTAKFSIIELEALSKPVQVEYSIKVSEVNH
jgi:hypothetical protein